MQALLIHYMKQIARSILAKSFDHKELILKNITYCAFTIDPSLPRNYAEDDNSSTIYDSST